MNNDFVSMTGHVHDGNYKFVFLNDNTACELNKNGDIKRVGVHKISYSQNEILNKIYNSFNTNNLEKGECFEYSDYFKIVFSYKTLVEQNKINENRIDIKVPKTNLEDENCYNNFNRLLTMCNQLNKIKIINQQKIEAEKKRIKLEKKNNFIWAVVLATSMLLTAGSLAYAISESAKADQENQQQLIDDINNARKAKGKPPIDLVDDDGHPYDSWDAFYSDVAKKQENDNSNEEEIEPLFEETGPIL